MAAVCATAGFVAAARAQTCNDGCFYSNTYQGQGALQNFTAGYNNSAFGTNALFNNTGTNNTAFGTYALLVNTEGLDNTAIGSKALYNNISGNYNTASGAYALLSNTYGYLNVATGYLALSLNSDGDDNTASGSSALENNTGTSNIGIGESAGSSLTTGSNNIDIGNAGKAGESAKIRIGTTGTHKAAFIAGISGVTVPSGVGVIVGTDGKLGTVVSSAQFKDQVEPMNKASEAIHALQPVTFRYKHELDPDGIPQFGLVAEEVAKVDPDLVARDEEGKPYTVRYEAVNAMLLNEFLKEHRKGQEQDATIAELKSALAEQQREIKALATGVKEQAEQIQKVSAERAISRATPRLVATKR